MFCHQVPQVAPQEMVVSAVTGVSGEVCHYVAVKRNLTRELLAQGSSGGGARPRRRSSIQASA
jgi:hypothetical protein